MGSGELIFDLPFGLPLAAWKLYVSDCKKETSKCTQKLEVLRWIYEYILQFIKSIHVHKNYDVDIEFNISFAEFQNFKSKSTFVGEEYMTEAHKMGNYSELRSSEPWTPDRLLAN